MWQVRTIYRGHEDPAEDGQESLERFEEAAQAEAQFRMRAAAVGVAPALADAALSERPDDRAPAEVSADRGVTSIAWGA